MQRCTSISLLFLFLFGTLLPGQVQEELTKVPILWGHFREHKNETPNVTFYQYLKLHYGDDVVKHFSAHDHSKLPMKSGDHHLHAPLPIDLPELLAFVLKMPSSEYVIRVFIDQTYSFLPFDNIWQPPKSC